MADGGSGEAAAAGGGGGGGSVPVEAAGGAPDLTRQGSEGDGTTWAQPPSGLRDVADIVKTDAADESLNRYKAALLGSEAMEHAAELRGDPEITLLDVVLLHEGHEDIRVALETPEERVAATQTEVVVKEGATFSIRIHFTVQRNIVSGLQLHVSVANPLGLTLARERYMLGSYAPCTKDKPHTWVSEEDEHAKGFFARGKYTYRVALRDDDGREYLRASFPFVIAAEWPSSAGPRRVPSSK